MKRLANRKDIVIKSSDKGGGVTILSCEQYENEAYSQLHDPKYYAPCDESTFKAVNENIKDSITTNLITGALPPKSANLLKVPDAKPGRFYLLPKVHKNLDKPPGRPIVSGNGTPTERISQYVDEHIKPFAPKIDSYIKDTSHFLSICK